MAHLLMLANFLFFWFQDAGSVDSGAGAAAGAAIFGLGFLVFGLLFMLLMVASIWKIFVKAGEPGWAALIPIYNTVVLLKIINKPIWWLVLTFIPGLNFIIFITMFMDLAKKFGKGSGFGIAMFLFPFIFLPLLAFSDSRYQAA